MPVVYTTRLARSHLLTRGGSRGTDTNDYYACMVICDILCDECQTVDCLAGGRAADKILRVKL